MLLSDIKAYLKAKQRVSLAELSVVFGLAGEVIIPMIAHFIRKGWVNGFQGQACRGCEMACSSCDTPLWYEWQGAK